MDVSRIGIAELAEMLEDRKNNDQNFALILGSRTGALFRSQQFAEEMALYNTSAHSFVDSEERDHFSRYYSLLKIEKKQRSSNDLKHSLNQKIRNIPFSPADECLAALVKQGIFRTVLYCNPDDILYEAFTALELKKREEYAEFDIDLLAMTEDFGRVVYAGNRRTCKVINLYNDIDAFVYSLDKPQEQQERGLYVRKLLDHMSIKEVLIMGIDLQWDDIILDALPSRVKTVWFVNEDEQVKETFRSKYKKIEQFMFITGKHAEYEKILKTLHFQINPGILPRRYEMTSELRHQLNLMQRDLTSIKDGLESLETKVTTIQSQIIRLSQKVQEAQEAQEATRYDAGEKE
ncbi:MAG TPA: hypothetical protein VN207_12075 [Ktedonobacteraceae bacterium]|nr:hypothetical protein [Ktedonobacteraceae bacterium]